MANYDPIFEVVHTAAVRPETCDQFDRYIVVTLPYDPSAQMDEMLLVFAETERLKTRDLRKLANAIYYFACRYNCTDESKISFLLWFADLLCKKLSKSASSLHCEGLHWFLAKRDARFVRGDYKTIFITLHTFDEGCFTTAEMEALQEVGGEFNTWVEAGYEDPALEGGEREVVRM